MKRIIVLLFFCSFILINAQEKKSNISTFLMFEGKAETAMNFYISLFDKSELISENRYDDSQSSMAGKIKYATFKLNGTYFMCSDSPVQHDFTFTPSISIFVECNSSDELERLFYALSEDGKVFMPLDNYGFSEKFGWVEDKFGVSWQLNFGELK